MVKRAKGGKKGRRTKPPGKGSPVDRQPGEFDDSERPPELPVPPETPFRFEKRRNGCRTCRLVVLIGTDDAIRGARDWSVARASELGGCFQLWEIKSSDAPFVSIGVRDVTDGAVRRRRKFSRSAIGPRSRFSAMHPDLANGRGRFSEVVVFHHGETVKEEKVLDGLREILIDLLRIPVCRLVYWACNAAVEVMAEQGEQLDLLMRSFGRLSAESPCGCDGPVEVYLPTLGKCAITAPDRPPAIMTGDGLVRRIRFGYRHGDGVLRPQPDPSAGPAEPIPPDRDSDQIRGSVLGIPVTEDPALR